MDIGTIDLRARPEEDPELSDPCYKTAAEEVVEVEVAGATQWARSLSGTEPQFVESAFNWS